MIDWQQLTISLRQHYKPLERVADELGISHQHINRLARGDVLEPRYNSGVRMLKLAKDVLPADQFERARIE